MYLLLTITDFLHIDSYGIRATGSSKYLFIWGMGD